MTWEERWGSVHEAAHCVVARYFGMEAPARLGRGVLPAAKIDA